MITAVVQYVSTAPVRLLAAVTALAPIPADPNGLPGTTQLLSITGGVIEWALIACAIVVICGGVGMYVGNHSQNYTISLFSRRSVIAGFAGAILVAAAVPIVNWGSALGGKVG